MKKSDIVIQYEDIIIQTMIEYFRKAYENHGIVEYDIYLYEDGRTYVYERITGDHSSIVADDLYYITSIKGGDVWWAIDSDEIPEDPDEVEEIEEYLIDEEVNAFVNNYVDDWYRDILESAIEYDREIELERKWDEYWN